MGVLQRHEGLDGEMAGAVARVLHCRTQDVRDAVRVSTLSTKVRVKREVELLLTAQVVSRRTSQAFCSMSPRK